MLEPDLWRVIEWPVEQQPMLVVVVDTEAEFDWASGGPRRAGGVTSVTKQAGLQPIFDRHGVRPTLVLDYPVSSTPEAYELVRELYRTGRCEIGAHLQPWDTPPFVEALTEQNSYPGNLPPEIERQKLACLTAVIGENLGVAPRIYKAGRYGVGAATTSILAELGYEIDLSVVPGADLTRAGGPDFSHCGAHPYWFHARPVLLEIPLSTGHTGLISGVRRIDHFLTMHPRLKALRVPGVLARLGLVDRVILTPEGVTLDEQRRLTRAMLRRGHRVLSLTYHSSSLVPGNTPYVRDESDLRAFVQRIEQYLEFFVGNLGGRPATPFEVKTLAERLANNADHSNASLSM
jgi:hypothetical protein